MKKLNILYVGLYFAGPNKLTVDDMWRMVWEQRSYSIVMVTSLIELGKVSMLAITCTADLSQGSTYVSNNLLSHLEEAFFSLSFLSYSYSESFGQYEP